LDAEKSKGFRKRMWVSAAVAFFLWLLLVGGGMSALIFERMKLEKLQKKDELLFPEANAVRAVKRKTNRIQCYMNHTNSALESLREISRLLPPKDIDLSEFTYRKEESIAVVGESKTGQLVLEFNKNLNGSKSFAEVIPGSRHLTKQRHHRFRFEIKLPGGRE
ncbi:hypothetical protein H8D64_02055, partial [PVC group bacterium]|nr:hypothetical protein [PVC group bacterium]